MNIVINNSNQRIGYTNVLGNASLLNKKEQLQENTKAQIDMTEEEKEQAFYDEYMRNNTLQEKEYKYMMELSERLKNGETLTEAEQQYLKSKNKDLYEDSKEIAKECKEYEEAIKSAKTKEDVTEIKLQRISDFSKELKSVKDNPYIQGGDKLEVAKKINDKILKMEETYSKVNKENGDKNEKTRPY